jgi:hypothetical protein
VAYNPRSRNPKSRRDFPIRIEKDSGKNARGKNSKIIREGEGFALNRAICNRDEKSSRCVRYRSVALSLLPLRIHLGRDIAAN